MRTTRRTRVAAGPRRTPRTSAAPNRLCARKEHKSWLSRHKTPHPLLEHIECRPREGGPALWWPNLPGVSTRSGAGREHVHRRNVLHADMKPGNVMLSRAGEVKVIDYG